MLNKKSGITLIAFIITIIILLILAGVVVNLSMGENGIIAKTQIAANTYQNAQEKEKIQIAKAENEIENYVDGNRSVSEDRIREIIGEEISNALSSEISDAITDAIANANKEEVLWTNPNPTADFGAQTVSWTSTEYNRVYILYKNYKNDSIPQYTAICFSGKNAIMLGAWNNTTETYYYTRSSSFNSNKKSVYFGDCYMNSKTKSNHMCTPMYVIGFKGTLNL